MIKNIKSKTELSSLYFIYKGSADIERNGEYGISHFLEHLKCKAFDDMQNILQQYDIQWNAYTSQNEIVFYFKGLEEYLSLFRDEIIERMYLPFNKYITSEIIENEKGIVIEEYNGAFSYISEASFMNILRKRFHTNSPIGLETNINDFDYELCENFYNKQYLYPDMILSISKDYILDKDLKFEYRNNLPFEPKESYYTYVEELPETNKEDVYFITEIEDKDTSDILMFSYLLSSGLNSPLYQEVREKKSLCYMCYSEIINIKGKKYFIIGILTSDNKSKETIDVVNNILEDINIHINDKRFNTIKINREVKIKTEDIQGISAINFIEDYRMDFREKILNNEFVLNDILNVFYKYSKKLEIITTKKY